MVVFTCNTCSAVLKRNKVDSHCYQCRGCESLSCVDCGKDFWGDDYQQHTKCISEGEKYGRKDAVHKANKGEVKQEQWVEQVQAAIDKASSKPSLKRLLERLKQYPNIPRKKVKFENFVKNSLKCYDNNLIAASWDVLMANKTQAQSGNKQEDVQEKQTEANGHEKEEMNGNDQADEETSKSSTLKNKKERKEERKKKFQKKEKKDKAVEATEDDTSTSNDVSKKSKKRKRHDMEDVEDHVNNDNLDNGDNVKKSKKKKNKSKEVESTQTENNDECNSDDRVEEEASPPKKRKKTKFDWEMVVKTVLEKKGELPLKKLKRKVLSEFAAQDAANYNDENLGAMFDKKVMKMKGVKVSKERASLKE